MTMSIFDELHDFATQIDERRRNLGPADPGTLVGYANRLREMAERVKATAESSGEEGPRITITPNGPHGLPWIARFEGFDKAACGIESHEGGTFTTLGSVREAMEAICPNSTSEDAADADRNPLQAENAALKAKVAALEAKCKHWFDEFEKADSWGGKQSASLEIAEDHLDEAKRSIQCKVEAIEQLECRITDLIQGRKAQNTPDASALISQQASEIERLKGELATLRSRVGRLVADRDHWLEQSTGSRKSNERLAAENARLQSRLDASDAENSKLRSDLWTCLNERDRARDAIQDERETCESFVKIATALQDESAEGGAFWPCVVAGPWHKNVRLIAERMRSLEAERLDLRASLAMVIGERDAARSEALELSHRVRAFTKAFSGLASEARTTVAQNGAPTA